MNSHFELVPAKPGDERKILGFIRELAEYERLLDDCVATEEQLKSSLFGPSPKVFAQLALLDGEAVGFCLYFFTFSTFLGKHGLYLEDLYIQPEFRNRGLGKAIMKELAKIALLNECGRFEWSVLDWNAPSIAFYRKIGAIGMDEWTVQRVDGAALTALAEGRLESDAATTS